MQGRNTLEESGSVKDLFGTWLQTDHFVRTPNKVKAIFEQLYFPTERVVDNPGAMARESWLVCERKEEENALVEASDVE